MGRLDVLFPLCLFKDVNNFTGDYIHPLFKGGDLALPYGKLIP